MPWLRVQDRILPLVVDHSQREQQRKEACQYERADIIVEASRVLRRHFEIQHLNAQNPSF